MALSNMAVFSEFVYSTMTEILDQQVQLFNTASRGAIALQSAAHVGDYSDLAFWQKIQGLVRRRNAYAGDNDTLTAKNMDQIVDTMVKVAAGSEPILINQNDLTWIQRNPQESGAVYGRQLAVDAMGDMLNTGLMGFVAATSGESEVVTDAGAPTEKATFLKLNQAAALFGDRAENIVCWIMHSTTVFQLYANALGNVERLFVFGTVNVRQDGFGRTFIISDSPSLRVPPSTGVDEKYYVPGLVPGAVNVHQNNDFNQNVDTRNEYENIRRTIQSEWTYQLGVRGYSWDKTNGGPSPADAALGSSANWDRYATSHKDLAGVMLEHGIVDPSNGD